MSEINISEKYAANIIKELWTQRENPQSVEFCDVVLIAGTDKTRIHAHSCVLSAASEYFKRMFMSSMRESTTNEVKMPTVDCDILLALLQYFYMGEIKIDADRVVELLEAAEMLLVREIVTSCADTLAENLHPSNCLGVTLLAEQYRCETLLQKSKDYTLEHFMDVRKTDEFLSLNEEQLRELLTCDNLTVSSEEDVFNSLKIWIEYIPGEREKHKAEMLNLVRLPLLEKPFLMEQVKPFCASPEYLQIYIDALEQKISPNYINSNENKSVKPRKLYQLLMGITISKSKMKIHYHCPQRLKWMKWFKDLEYRSNSGVAVMENYIFLVGGIRGIQDYTPLNTVVCLNLKTMNLKEVSPMTEHRGWCSAAVLNGVLYAVGGAKKDGSILNSVEKWNPETNTWSNVAPMTVSRCAFGLAVSNDKLYAVGGLSSGKIKINSAEYYDPQQNVWIPIAAMRDARYRFGIAVSNGLVYAMGGHGGNKAVERYDPKTNSWTMLCSLNDVLAGDELCTTFLDKVIVCHKNRIDEYSDETNEWKTSASVKVLLGNHLMFTYSGELFKSEFDQK